ESARRRTNPGRTNLASNDVNVFAGLLKNALGGDSYCFRWRMPRKGYGKKERVLMNQAAHEGRGQCRSFPFATFEAAILSRLKEIDPHEILNGDSKPDESTALSAQLAGVEAELDDATAFMDANGFSPAIGKRVATLEARKTELGARLREAQVEA